MSQEMTGAEMVVQAMLDNGVEHVFGYPGGAVLPIYDAIFQQEKLKHILESIVGIVASEAMVDEYLVKYQHALEGALSAAPFVSGMKDFLSACECPLYLCSSAPAGEVAQQLAARHLQGYFAEVFDGRTPKDRALKHIAHRHGNKGIVFFGDSPGDLVAAQSAGVPFVAVVAEWDNFGERTVVKLRDFTDRDIIRRCISEAKQAYAI